MLSKIISERTEYNKEWNISIFQLNELSAVVEVQGCKKFYFNTFTKILQVLNSDINRISIIGIR